MEAYLMGAIRLGILNCVLIGIIGASEVVTFAEKYKAHLCNGSNLSNI